MGMNYEEFNSYVKKHGITKARTTKNFCDIPQGTILFFWYGNGVLSTFDERANNLNRQFGYDFDYSWSNRWRIDYKGIFELIDEQKQNSPSNNVKMTKKTIYQVIAVNKKTGETTKNETITADNEQQAILKTFGVDAENTFIKTTEVGTYEEDKPLKAVLEKEEKPAK